MHRAIDFYETFFDQSVTESDELYSVFDIHGFRLGLFAYDKAGERHTFGTNCLPSIEVYDINILKKKLETVRIIFPITKIGDNWVSEFEDSEGNHIELTTKVKE